MESSHHSALAIESIAMTTTDFISELFTITRPASHRTPLKIACRWKREEDAKYYGALQLYLRILPTAYDGMFEDATDTALSTLFDEVWGGVQDSEIAATAEKAITVILIPQGREGYVCRSDFLNLRTGQSPFVERVVAFTAWNQYLLAHPVHNHDDDRILALLKCAPGALLLTQPPNRALQEDLKARLSFDWLLPSKPTVRRVAVVSGRPFPDRKRGMYSAQGYFAAARALGIALVVVDNPGHWLEDDAHQDLRDEFVAVDLDVNRLDDLPHRLVTALKDKHLDGILTFWDVYVPKIAEAAEILGLPTASSKALHQAHTKHELRKIVREPDIQAFSIEHPDQLNDPSMAEMISNLHYPIIVKPSRGGASENVKKVTCEKSMREAVRMAYGTGFITPNTSHVLLETYVDGPEVDANFVLWDGEVLFLEVTDNFPCAADATNATFADSFQETVQISNSRLPPDEIEAIRASLHQSILKLGFRSGVFHLEARMRNSSMKYRTINGDRLVDLHPDPDVAANRNGKASAFLIEANIRPPGTGGTWATLFTYGVDLGALHFLCALEDRERFVALSRPYEFSAGSPGNGGGAQYWTAQCLVPLHRDNIRVPDDLWERVYQAAPELEPYVTRAEMYTEPGKVVSRNRGVLWIGYVLLFSRTSRRHVLEMYHQLAKTCIKVLDEEMQ